MRCLHCGAPGAYMSAVDLYCPNPACSRHDDKQRAAVEMEPAARKKLLEWLWERHKAEHLGG